MGPSRGRSHYRHEAGAREALGGVLMLVTRYFRGVQAAANERWRLAVLSSFIATEYNG